MKEVFMRRAFELAKKGLGEVSPNPCVGAVIVKGERIVAEGWHKKAGTDHAEIVAIREIMKKSGIVTVDIEPALFQNAVLYVTLEPCCHYGKTAPCTAAIVSAGFKKVCIGMKDPFSKVNGKGISFLKKNGIEVEILKQSSKLTKEIRELNQPFIKSVREKMPYVIMKAGISLDGKIATNSGDSKWITSSEARNDSRNLRSLCDAVVVGIGTVNSDDPELAGIGKFKKKNILRVILDRKLQSNLDARVFRDENVFVACTDLASKKNQQNFRMKNVEFKSFGRDKINLEKLLKFLASKNIQSVFVEGGSSVHGSFYDAALKNRRLLDRIVFYIAPKIIGGKNSLPVVGGEGIEKLKNASLIEDLEVAVCGTDLKISGNFNFY